MLRWLVRPAVARWGATQAMKPLASVVGDPSFYRLLSATPSSTHGGSGVTTTSPDAGAVPVPAPAPAPAKHRWLPKWMLKESIVAGPDFSRWRIAPASMAIHLCIGSVYAWSIFNTPLTREFGVIASSAADWSLGSVVPIFSTAIVCLGLSAAVAGKWLEEVGPRAVGLLSAVCWGGGFAVASLGLHYHSLPLVYAGYGVLGGCGLGLGYVSPVSTLIRWFPDRRGFATGLAIMGFGGGAMVATPLKEALLRYYSTPPTFLGPTSAVHVVTEEGRRLAEVGESWREVIVATHADVAASGFPGLAEGVYLVGTGNTGAAATFLTLGAAYFSIITAGALSYRVPAEGWLPMSMRGPEGGPAPVPTAETSAYATPASMITTNHVHIDDAHKTPQFWGLWTCLCMNVTAGIGVIGVAKTMITDMFGKSCGSISTEGVPSFLHGVLGVGQDGVIVASVLAANYVFAISVFNMMGRLGWASMSDVIGRRNTYFLFFAGGIPLYLMVPYIAAMEPGLPTLGAFTGLTMVIFSFYGGGFATIPAYIADLFGTKFVGGIHGRLLTAWSTAGIMGPVVLTTLRQHSVTTAVNDLTSRVDSNRFLEAFGADKSQLDKLVEAKTVTIARLMEIAPEGTVDPTPFLYNSTMHAMAGMLSVALVSNALLRPVSAAWHMKHD